MRFNSFLKPIVAVTLLLSLMPFASSISIAQSPTPTQPPKPRAMPRAPGQYTVYLPAIQVAGLVPLNKGVPLTYADCASVGTVQASWEYAWGPNPPDCAGVENIPMIWGETDINATLGGNSQWIMGFNEPDSSSQANLSPSQAALLWRQIEQKYPNRKLLAPAPSGAGSNWIADFRNAYISTFGTAPRLDGLAVHCFAWYASQCIPHTQQFETWATSWGVAEVWVTEFSFSPTAPSSPTQALQEAQTFINWMVSEPKITRYAWFASKIQGTEWWLPPNFNTPLVDWNTQQPTTFGNMYLPYR